MLIRDIRSYDENGRFREMEYVQIDRTDAYSMDTKLAGIILPLLRVIREDKQGLPNEIMPLEEERNGDQLLLDIFDPDAEREIREQYAEAAWNACVDKMIYAFNEIANGPYLCGEHKMTRADRIAYYERIQEGLNLFAEHYFSLHT